MCSSERGFSLVELLVALAISVLLMLAIGPLWVGMNAAAESAGDEVTLAGQSRVAVARLERDLRTATADVPEEADGAAILRASPTELVLLTHAGGVAEVIEWEIVGGSLMRRRGPWPTVTGGRPSHGWYTDHKSMLEGLGGTSHFAYLGPWGESDHVTEAGPDLGRVQVVRFEATVGPDRSAHGTVSVRMWGRVGR